jgi:hypothetical protein
MYISYIPSHVTSFHGHGSFFRFCFIIIGLFAHFQTPMREIDDGNGNGKHNATANILYNKFMATATTAPIQ